MYGAIFGSVISSQLFYSAAITSEPVSYLGRIGVTRYTGNWVSAATASSPADIAPFGMTFKPDGTKMYYLGYTGDIIRMYDLPTAWSLDGATLTGDEYDLTTYSDWPIGLDWKRDGSQYFISDLNNQNVLMFNTAASWSLSGSSYSGVQYSFSASDGYDMVRSINFTDDGLRMYGRSTNLDNNIGSELLKYELSTAWDISTMTLVQTASLAVYGTPQAVTFDADEVNFIIAGQTQDSFIQLRESVRGDISTLYEHSRYKFQTEAGVIEEVYLKKDGGKIFACDNNSDKFYEYQIEPEMPATSSQDVTFITDTNFATWKLAEFNNANGYTYTWTWWGAVTGSTTQTDNIEPTIDFSGNTNNDWIYINVHTSVDWSGLTSIDLWAGAHSRIKYMDISNVGTNLLQLNTRYALDNGIDLSPFPNLTYLGMRGNYRHGLIDLSAQTLVTTFNVDVVDTHTIIMPATGSFTLFQAYSSDLTSETLDTILIALDSYGISSGTADLYSTPGDPTNASYAAYNSLTASGWTINIDNPPPSS